MAPPSATSTRWLEEASSIKKRLRSATLLLSSPNPPSAKTPAIAAKNSSQPLHPEFFNGAETDIDAEYKLFLEHLRVDGKSYVLEMVIGGGSGPPLCLKYEEDDDASEVIQTRSPGSRGSAARSFTGRKRLKGQDSNLESSEVFAPCSLVAAEWEDGSMVDENYQNFLSHVRAYNGSMILELDNNVVVRYEEEVEEIVVRYGEEVEERVAEKEQAERLGAGTEDLGKSSVVSGSMELQPYLAEKEQVERLGAGTEDLGKSSVVSGSMELQPYVAEKEQAERLGAGTEDLGKSSVVSGSMELQPYDGSLQLSNTSAIEEDNCSVETLSCGIPASFESRLMSIRQKPFDQKEYDELMKMATVRTPIMRSKELRNKTKIYRTKELGLSYLEHYPALARQLENKDFHERLDLLRGFFFWLQNVGHDGAYMPWLKAKEKMQPLEIEISEK